MLLLSRFRAVVFHRGSRARCPHRTRKFVGCFVESLHTDHLDWSLPAHRRGTLCGMDAAEEPTWTYLRRVPRWWAGKGPALK
ncbi:hypothetical protein FFY45_11235 [Xanthomonas hortorum]|nr:hypothetical protein [Xanthomonas hortorum]